MLYPKEASPNHKVVLSRFDMKCRVLIIYYYRNSLIGGQDSFVEVAGGFDEFAQAIRRKLIREIYPPLSSMFLPRHAAAKLPQMPARPSMSGVRANASSRDRYGFWMTGHLAHSSGRPSRP